MLQPRTLDILSRVMERAQKGRRIAVGADTSLEDQQDRHIIIEYAGIDELISRSRRLMEEAQKDGTKRLSDMGGHVSANHPGIKDASWEDAEEKRPHVEGE